MDFSPFDADPCRSNAISAKLPLFATRLSISDPRIREITDGNLEHLARILQISATDHDPTTPQTCATLNS
jgi:hypothetical protein